MTLDIKTILGHFGNRHRLKCYQDLPCKDFHSQSTHNLSIRAILAKVPNLLSDMKKDIQANPDAPTYSQLQSLSHHWDTLATVIDPGSRPPT